MDVCQPSRLLFLNGRVSLVRCMSTKSTFIPQWKGLLSSMSVNQVDLYSSFLNGRVSLVRCLSTRSTFIPQWKGLIRSMSVNQVDLYSSMEGSPYFDVCQPSRPLFLNGRVSLVRCLSTKSTFIPQWKGLLS